MKIVTIAGAGALLLQEHGKRAFMAKIRRRGMTRWELPSAVIKAGERAEDTLNRCVFEDSNRRMLVNVWRPICLYLHQSQQLERTFFGMFFLCSADEQEKEREAFSYIELSDKIMPQDARQQFIQSDFIVWRDIPEREIHPLHKKLLLTWDETKGREMFLISGNADAEIPFYFGWTKADSLGISVVFPSSSGQSGQV